MAINEARLQAFLARALYDLAATQSAALVVIGDRLGLYKAMSVAGPVTPGELARRTGTNEAYVGEWLVNQACGGYVEYDPRTSTFSLGEEQALALAVEDSRAFVAAAFQAATGVQRVAERLEAAFRTGAGVPRDAYGPDVFEGIARSARARYEAHLLSTWIPALEGVAEKLASGASVADVGCGQGTALLVLARAFPRSRFVGFDTHAPSLDRARGAAEAAGLPVRFETASATDFPGAGYDLVTCFDSLHEMGNPAAAAARIRGALAPDGTWLIVEPFAADRLEDNVGPGGRFVSSLSALHCLPVSRAEGGAGLGAMAGEGQIAEVVMAGGFTRVRRVAEIPLSLVLEARP